GGQTWSISRKPSSGRASAPAGFWRRELEFSLIILAETSNVVGLTDYRAYTSGQLELPMFTLICSFHAARLSARSTHPSDSRLGSGQHDLRDREAKRVVANGRCARAVGPAQARAAPRRGPAAAARRRDSVRLRRGGDRQDRRPFLPQSHLGRS